MEIFKKKKILIVDDESTALLVHNELLKKLGAMEILEASNAQEALDCIEKNEPDLIISDYLMPEMTGLDLYKALISRNIHTPFAMVTANSNAIAVKEMIELGINAILVKPVTKEMLIARLSKIL